MAETAKVADEARLPAFRDGEGGVDAGFVEAVDEALQLRDVPALRRLVAELHEADMGDLIEALDAGQRPRLIALLGADFDFTALTEVDDSVREEILDELSPEAVAEGVRTLDTDDAVYILEDLGDAEKREVLARLPPSERLALQQGLDYPEDSAGRRMQSEVIAVPAFWTVGHTIDHLRETEDLPERFFEIFATDPAYRFVGAVRLDRLLRAKRPILIADLIEEGRRVFHASDSLEDVAHDFQHYNLIAAPVLDAGGRLVGVLTIDDVVDLIEEAADEDAKQLGGVDADEELSDSVREVALGRFRWRFVSLIASLIAASVMAMFEDQLSKLVALAVLAPIVASQGGNAATQTMTVAVRALATRELGGRNLRRFFRREMIVGLLNGVAFAVLTGLVALLWFGNAMLGGVVAIAMIVTLLVAALAGALVPVALDRAGIDPAISSGTFVTTTTDVIGFFSFLGFATVFLGL